MNLDLSTLAEAFGDEHDPGHVARELKVAAHGAGAAAIGAMLLTCSDEAMSESTQRFTRGFVQETVPPLKHGLRAPFVVATPGAWYPWGSAQVATNNFGTADLGSGFLLLVVKVHAHVAAVRSGSGSGTTFGHKRRYHADGTFCGALGALLQDSKLPLLEELAHAMRAEGVDRVAALSEAPPENRLLRAAALSARLMARNVAMDVQHFTPRVPTVYLIHHGVVINKDGPDTELPGGAYRIDRRPDILATDVYQGLGDDPSKYQMTTGDGSLSLNDGESAQRRARDHHSIAGQHVVDHDLHGLLGHLERHPEREQLEAARQATARGTLGHPYAKVLLKVALIGLTEVAPVAAAMLLLSEGAVAIRHAHRLRHPHEHERKAGALAGLHGLEERIDALDDEKVTRLARRLLTPGHRD